MSALSPKHALVKAAPNAPNDYGVIILYKDILIFQ